MPGAFHSLVFKFPIWTEGKPGQPQPNRAMHIQFFEKSAWFRSTLHILQGARAFNLETDSFASGQTLPHGQVKVILVLTNTQILAETVKEPR